MVGHHLRSTPHVGRNGDRVKIIVQVLVVAAVQLGHEPAIRRVEHDARDVARAARGVLLSLGLVVVGAARDPDCVDWA